MNSYKTKTLDQLLQIKLDMDDLYYNTGHPGMSDEEYDLLKEEIEKRDTECVKGKVGATLREGENRVKLPFWLGSADKITKQDALERWLAKNPSDSYVLSEKLDGVSCLFMYDAEKISKGDKEGISLYTRGDGEIGADISYLSKYVDIGVNFGRKLIISLNKLKTNLYVRGELIMEKKDFDMNYSKVYKNPRNMVSGLVSSKTSRQGLDKIKFVAYEILGDKTMENPFVNMDKLEKLGFYTVKRESVKTLSIESLKTLLTKYKANSKFEIDGLIVQTDVPYDRNIDGNPKYLFAFKMLSEENIRTVIIKSIEWNVSKWGILKPVVIIDPVVINGVSINRITAHNAKYVEDNCLRKGSLINITRSNDVIPYIVEVIKDKEKNDEKHTPDFPNDTEYEWDDTHVNIVSKNGKDSTLSCIKLIASMFSKLGIKFVSEATVHKMYMHGLDSFLKIISAKEETLLRIPTFKEKTVKRIIENIKQGLSDVKMSDLLGASGVLGYGIGSKKIDMLLTGIPDFFENEDIEENYIENIEGFSSITAKKILENRKTAKKFLKKVEPFVKFKTVSRVSNSLSGMKIAMSGFRDKKLEQDITENGGKVVGSVSKNTSCLIFESQEGEEGAKATGKVSNAHKYGVVIYNKKDFKKKYKL